MPTTYLKLVVFITIFISAVSSKFFQNDGLFLQNPGQGVNFYGKIQSNPDISASSAEKAFDNAVQPQECAQDNSTCPEIAISDHYPGIVCQIDNPVPCDYSYPYRTYDGSCNNPYSSRFGQAGQCYERFMPPHYDGYGGFRKSVKGGPLPPPRELSLKIFKEHHTPDVNVTSQFANFGEYSSLDFLFSEQPPLKCCHEENKNNPECIPIALLPNDPFFSQFNKTCLDLQRTYPCNCNTHKRAQRNGQSAHLDDSQLYGVTKEAAMKFRAMDGTGQLRHNDSSVGCLLPSGKFPGDPFCPKGMDPICFTGADPRINHHVIVMSHFTIFMREHNRLATELKNINPHWGEEKLFQEARKINIAQHQFIYFKEYAPILLTPRIVEEFNLTVPEGSKGIEYNASNIPGTWNEFAIGTMRLHTTVRKNIGSYGLQFKQTFSNPGFLRHKYHMTNVLKGIREVPAEKTNRYMITDLSDYLYLQPGKPYGKDLASFDIQRGRDHGLAPYVEVVKFCSDGTVNIQSFDDLHNLGLMSKDNVNLLETVYKAVEDIDFVVGMNLEKLMPGAPISPTTVCINAKQFFFIQKGDRFYFDIVGPNAPFTTEQRMSIKKCSWSRILCDNTEISNVTKQPFLLPSAENSEVPCSEIPKVDLNLWKDKGNSNNSE